MASAIDQVEAEFDLTLVTGQRSRGIRATASGLAVARKCEHLLEDYRSLLAEGADLKRSSSGTLRIGYYAPVAPAFLPGILAAFVPDAADVELHLDECDNDGAPVLPCLLPGSHRLARRTSVTVAEIAKEPLVVLNRPVAAAYYRGLFDAHERALDRRLRELDGDGPQPRRCGPRVRRAEHASVDVRQLRRIDRDRAADRRRPAAAATGGGVRPGPAAPAGHAGWSDTSSTPAGTTSRGRKRPGTSSPVARGGAVVDNPDDVLRTRPRKEPPVHESDILLRDRDADGILRLTLNDVARRNALSEAMLAALGGAIAEADADAATRVVVLAAEGPAFSAGHDLKEMTAARSAPDRGRAYFTEVLATCAGVMQGIVRCPKPVIAEVTGVATAAGCQLVASCDLAVAADTARFSTPGVHIGLFCSTPMVALSRNVAAKHAMEMLLTGDMTSAARAAEIGLVNRAVAPERLRDTVMEMARTIASKSGATLAIGKRAFHEQREMPLSDAYAHASAVMVENMLHRDAEEGIGAFVDKRAPRWGDR